MGSSKPLESGSPDLASISFTLVSCAIKLTPLYSFSLFPNVLLLLCVDDIVLICANLSLLYKLINNPANLL